MGPGRGEGGDKEWMLLEWTVHMYEILLRIYTNYLIISVLVPRGKCRNICYFLSLFMLPLKMPTFMFPQRLYHRYSSIVTLRASG